VNAESTTCCVVGGGPAGMVLGLLLAMQGVDVVVLEKHTDFLRDFRGDTVHPSTLRLLDELGLAEAFLRLPHQEIPRIGVTTDAGTFAVADFTRLPGRFPFLTFVPQWDFLDFLADEARGLPAFSLRMGTEAVGLLREDGRVVGVRYRTRDGTEGEIRAALTVSADGRNSRLRAESGLRLRDFGAPIDVLWFRLPEAPGDRGPSFGGMGRISRGRMMVMIDRGDYRQTAYVVPKDGFAALRDAGIESFRAELSRLVPAMSGAIATLHDWDQVSVLSVRVDRLTRWHRPGLLVIGDAAHAMSPIGGVGINLAVQDAAAAARLLAGRFRDGGPSPARLALVRLRRLLPTALVQLGQRQIQRRVLARVLSGDLVVGTPRVLRLLQRYPALQGIPARVIGLGVLPEHAPRALRRRPVGAGREHGS
jgi:2-polyprenyl-6-methoxyphenol hydroxylase-like FAD-dependent oxidoreductase